jgi:polar amino acid transport system substrate-binding protein
MRNKLILCVVICTFLISGAMLNAKEYKVAVNQISTSDYYVNLTKAIGEVTGNTFDIQVVPRARCIYLIENKQVDFQIPNSLMPTVKLSDINYDYSTVTLMKTAYVLYINKSANITIDELKKGNPKKYKIEALASLENAFGFAGSPSTNAEASFAKLNNGQIDGFIFSQSAGDPVLKKLGLKNIKRLSYDNFQLKIAIQKGAVGGEVDKMLTDGINKLKANGKYNQIMADLIKESEYNEWQM